MNWIGVNFFVFFFSFPDDILNVTITRINEVDGGSVHTEILNCSQGKGFTNHSSFFHILCINVLVVGRTGLIFLQ